nr:hypothetical protein CFP56_59607 [Quercus suber]
MARRSGLPWLRQKGSWTNTISATLFLLASVVLAQDDTTTSTSAISSTSTDSGTSSDATSSATTTAASSDPTSNATLPADNGNNTCTCGYLDPVTNNVFTDAIIAYFNETAADNPVPSDLFTIDEYEHRYEKGWTIFYREGATASNVFSSDIGTAEWNIQPSILNLTISPYTHEHLVDGAQLQTVRKDILYGSFRALIKTPPWASGSAMTMRLEHNETISAALDLQPMDQYLYNATIFTTSGGEPPANLSAGLNYTSLPSYENVWGYVPYRMDWSKDEIAYTAGNTSITSMATADATMVDMPSALMFKHWSNGNVKWMQGPPVNGTSAGIGWVRFFFNSSLVSESQLVQGSCDPSQYCSTEDWTLRQSTPYTEAMTSRAAVKVPKPSKDHTAGIAIIIASLAFSAVLIIHALARKASGKKAPVRSSAVPMSRPKMPTSPMPSEYYESKGRPESQAWLTAKSRPVSEAYTTQTDYEMENLRPMMAGSSTTLLDGNPSFNRPSLGMQGRSVSGQPLLPSAANSSATLGAYEKNSPYGRPGTGSDAIEPLADRLDASTADLLQKSPEARKDIVPEGSQAAANPGAKPVPPPAGVPQARTRVDYLAGLVAVCSLLVSCTHFILTFVPSVIEEYLPQHYASEYWARRTIEPFFFNEIWVGIFFTTSTRFLTSGYLRTGNLKTVAEKVVCRCPRLMIPITAVILFEYFLMDLGATTYLQYIPSISWSTWPSTSVYTNFGYFVDETLQLFYLIPNSAPQLTQNFCTGVLWTIPVQLQNSWLVLLGAVIIREIKTPWKRFAYYTFCIVNHWYALSWGSYFWFGLMLADLDITYKYRKSIQGKPFVHYPLLILACLLVFASLGNDLLSVWTGYTFSIEERNIHPEVYSSLNIGQTDDAGYPPYIEPKLNGLVFAVAAQYIVEISTWVQAVLSTKVFLWLFPHVFTIYLIHGLVFWSIGSLVCVFFASQGLAYWLNMLLTALICYATLFAALPIVTPVMEMLGKEITKGIWVSASEEPAPYRPTSYPLAVSEVREMVRRKDDER